MSEPIAEPPEESAAPLPVDPLGLGLRLLRLAPLLLLAFLLSGGAAASLSLTLGTRIYQAETILLYRPRPGAGEAISLASQQNLIKTVPNLEQVRHRLGLKTSLDALGQQLQIKSQRNTELLSIVARAQEPELAVQLATSLRDVFLERQESTVKEKLKRTLEDQEKRLSQIQQSLGRAEKELEQFTLKNKIVDLDKEAQWYLEQLTQLQVLYEQAQVERNSVTLQSQNVDRIVGELKSRIERERQDSPSMANLGDLNIQVQRLRDAIHDDKTQRSGEALLREKKIAYEQAEVLFERELISRSELEKARSAYDSQKALTIDTPQIREQKEKIEALNALAIPKGPVSTPSGTMLQEMTLKSFEIQLSLVTQDEKVRRLEQAIQASQARLDQIPKMQQKFAALQREVQTRAQEKSALEVLLSETRRKLEAQQVDFVVASEAQIPKFPIESNRRKLFLLLALGGGGLALGGALLWVLLDSKVLTPKELELALHPCSLGGYLLPRSPDARHLSLLARSLRRTLGPAPQCLSLITLTSTSELESVGQWLSQSWADQGERTVRVVLSRLLDEKGKLPSVQGNPSQSLLVLDSGTGEFTPALAQSAEFQDWLGQLTLHFDLVVLECPPAEQSIVADILAGKSQAAWIVVPSSKHSKGALKKLAQRLGGEGLERVGGVLTGADRLVERLAGR